MKTYKCAYVCISVFVCITYVYMNMIDLFIYMDMCTFPFLECDFSNIIILHMKVLRQKKVK